MRDPLASSTSMSKSLNCPVELEKLWIQNVKLPEDPARSKVGVKRLTCVLLFPEASTNT